MPILDTWPGGGVWIWYGLSANHMAMSMAILKVLFSSLLEVYLLYSVVSHFSVNFITNFINNTKLVASA